MHGFHAKDTLVVEVEAMLVMCCRAGGPLFRLSYPVPPPSTVRGLFKAPYHSNFVFPVPRRVEFLKPIQTVNLSQWMYRNSQMGPKGGTSQVGPIQTKNSVSPQSAVYLYDQHYRFHIDLWGIDTKRVERYKRRLQQGAFHSPPYLGTRECGVDITYPVVNPTPVDASVNLIERALPVGMRTEEIEVKNGVANYPEDTFDRLVELAAHRYPQRRTA